MTIVSRRANDGLPAFITLDLKSAHVWCCALLGLGMIDSHLPGIAAGLLLAAVVGYALFVYLKPLRGQHSGVGLACLALVVLWLVKTVALHWLPGFYFDMDVFREWALRITAVGPAHFYGAGYTADINYPPGGIYVLWPFGALGHALGLSWESMRIAVKLPPLLADLVIAATMFAYLRRSGGPLKTAWAGMLLVALNPAFLFDTVVWGQNDSVVTALMWLATLVILDGEYVLAAALLAFAVLVKPHALIIIPPLLCWVLRKDGLARLWRPLASFITTIIIAVVPFAVGRPWDWLPRYYSAAMASNPETSVNAFNLMAIVGGIRQPETTAVFGASAYILGMALMLAALTLSCVLVWRNSSPTSLMLAISLALLGEFMFAPRMHERYFYAGLFFFAPVALEGPFWFSAYALLTLNGLFNLAYVLHTLQTTFWMDTYSPAAMLSSALNLVIFGAVLSRITSLDREAWPRVTQRPPLRADSPPGATLYPVRVQAEGAPLPAFTKAD